MRRTASRPLPSGRIRPRNALFFGLALTVAGVIVLWLLSGLFAAALALAGSVYYVVLYTMLLKRHTTQNIVIGGGAGAFPVLVGSAIATGGIGWIAIELFAVVFFWTPPHFWSLALLLRKDYRDARVPMLPSVVSVEATHRAMLGYLIVLIVVSGLPAFPLGLAYAIPVGLLNAGYLGLAVSALRAETNRTARRLFHYSLVYLAGVFVITAAAALIAGARPG